MNQMNRFTLLNCLTNLKHFAYSNFTMRSTGKYQIPLSKPNLFEQNFSKCAAIQVSNDFCKKPLAGRVEFDFGKLTNQHFGTVHVKGQFPRIQPRFERAKVITSQEMEIMKKFLKDWVERFIGNNSNSKLFSGMEEVLVQFQSVVYPFQEMESIQLKMALKLYYSYYILDNAMEEAVLTVPATVIQTATIGLIQLIRNHRQIFVDVPQFPIYGFLFHAFQDSYLEFESLYPGYRDKMGGQIEFSLQRYFNAMVRNAACPIDGSCQEESYRNYRMILNYFDICVIICWILESGQTDLPGRIKNCSSIRRLLDLVNSICGLTNDLLGMQNEFGKNEMDNLVVFKVVEKGIPLETAVDQMCVLISDEIDDFLVLRDSLLEKFAHDPQLVKFLDISEAVIDGNNRFLSSSTRHQSAGFVKLMD